MFGTMINMITAPGETMETIVKEFNWKPIPLEQTFLDMASSIKTILESRK